MHVTWHACAALRLDKCGALHRHLYIWKQILADCRHAHKDDLAGDSADVARRTGSDGAVAVAGADAAAGAASRHAAVESPHLRSATSNMSML